MKRFTIIKQVILALVVVGAVIGYAGFTHANPFKSHLSQAHAPINILGDGLSADYSTQPTICTVPLVADIVLGSKAAAHWNTTNGSYPSGLDEMQIEDQGDWIVTPISFKSFTPLRDTRATATKEYVLLGGSVGGDMMRSEDAPSINSGQSYIGIFLPTYDTASKTYTQDSLELKQVLPITADGQVITKQKLVEQGQVSQQRQTMALTTFESNLNTCK